MTLWEEEDIQNVAALPYEWGSLRGRTILISGGTGFIGTFISNVIRLRNKRCGDEIKVVSLSRRGGVSDAAVKYIKADVSEPFSLEEPVDFILHLASNTHPEQYAKDPVGTIVTNVFGCNNLLKLAVAKKARFLLASSVEIYGQGAATPMNEKHSGYIDCNRARSGYNEAKRVCEALCQSYRQQYGADVVIARLARTFGPDSSKRDTKAMSQFMDNAVNGERIILRSKGMQRYSYSYVADTSSAILKVLLDGSDGEAYNVSDDDEGKTLGDYAEFLARLAGVEVEYRIEDNTSVSAATYALLDTRKIKSIGWRPLYTVTSGIERTFNIKRKKMGI